MAAKRDFISLADLSGDRLWTHMSQNTPKAQHVLTFPLCRVNANLVAAAGPQAIGMHCLPAHWGEENRDEVAHGLHLGLFDQAENLMDGA